MSNFIHLKSHTEFSMIDGILRVGELVNAAKKNNQFAVAVTDFSNLCALIKFYKKATKAGVKPIVGADVFVEDDNGSFPLTLLCQNQIGYQNLRELLSLGYTQGQHDGKPQLTFEWLAKQADGLIALSGAQFGDIGDAIIKNHPELAEQNTKKWLALFPDRFYIELQRTGREYEDVYIKAAVALAEKLNCPVVATNDCRFLKAEDYQAHEARVCIHDGEVLANKKRVTRYSDQQYVKSPEEMAVLFKDLPEALENTIEIAKRCTVSIKLGDVFLPNFPLPAGVDLETYITAQSRKGLEKRLAVTHPDITPAKKAEYDARLKRELDVIIEMGFPGYFLIVADFIGWAKAQGIPVGPGRGSGAGSLIAYVLEITALDPLEHELLFERFLNPERVSMPDFDIDFCMEGRDRVIDYVADRYGHDAVSQIITYGTMAAKAVIRDVGRVMGFPYGFVDKLAKLIPFEIGMTLPKAMEQEEALNDRYKNEAEVTSLIDLALKLEGITRNAGKHAGGVVIAPTKLTDFVALYCEPGGDNLVTQFDKDDVETIGLVKFDFLGLRTLTIINWAVQNIKASGTVVDIDTIPVDDKKSFQLLKNCQTTAVFQLESRGMKELIKRLQPDSFEEITALVALFRPGPLQSGMVDDFIDRKHGRAVVTYPHPDLEPILKPTYGVILYQEQVMQIAQVLAGYSLGGADILRRAMGKKKPEEMAKQRTIFTEGSVKRGIDKQLAESIFDLMEKFAGYGFNKSHSAAYALIAYQTAWLKAHYPAEFMAAVLSSDMDNTEKVVSFYEECQDLKIKIISPNINRGDFQFVVNKDGAIEYGLGAIKGVGEAVIHAWVEERNANGPYKNFFDFCHRVDTRKANRRILEALIRSGACDDFLIDNEVTRASLFVNINKALKLSDQAQRNATVGQNDLFAAPDETSVTIACDYETAAPWSQIDTLNGEKKTLGLYISGHPMQTYSQELSSIVQRRIKYLEVTGKNTVIIAGIVLGVRNIMTRTGKRMAILSLEDETGRIDVTLFSEVFETARDDLQTDAVLIVKGSVDNDEYTGGLRMVCEAVMTMEKVREQLAKRLLIKCADDNSVKKVLDQLPDVLALYKGGKCPMAIAYQNEQASAEIQLGSDWKVNPSSSLLEKLQDMFGRDRVSLEY